jgi:hypothetical protein
MSTVSNAATPGPAIERPILRRKPGFRCLKTVSNHQSQDKTSGQAPGKPSQFPSKDDGDANKVK